MVYNLCGGLTPHLLGRAMTDIFINLGYFIWINFTPNYDTRSARPWIPSAATARLDLYLRGVVAVRKLRLSSRCTKVRNLPSVPPRQFLGMCCCNKIYVGNQPLVDITCMRDHKSHFYQFKIIKYADNCTNEPKVLHRCNGVSKLSPKLSIALIYFQLQRYRLPLRTGHRIVYKVK